ncbi:MAG: type II toxin-antitoxin system HicA family toxin [Treponema sp.]|jgi:predicted RNA binding protein YcfA (HicA-like mRNA interferase family)|nr:type II toxin-antitoxin system HicA family toxin [Treponema sp.]
MKRNAFIKILNEKGVFFHQNGANHDIFIHKTTGKKIPVPRHTEIKNTTVRGILKEIPD